MTTKKTLYMMHDPVIHETVYSQKLDNGLQIFILPKKGFNQNYAIFSTNYGSIDNSFIVPGEEKISTVPDGIAHFLEHKMFEEEHYNIFEKFAALGANVNAYTTYTTTSYLFDTVDNFEECLELLLDFVQNLYLTDETVEKEKAIIEQEILMYDDDPDWVGYLNLMKALFQVHPVRVDIAGTVESIHRIRKEDLFKCYQTFYHPNNMVLFVQGDLDPEKVYEQVIANQVKKNFAPLPPAQKQYVDEPEGIFQRQIDVKMPVSRPIYNLGFKEKTRWEDGDKLLKRELMTNMLLEILMGKGSELYQNMYASGLIDDSFAVSYTAEIDHGMTTVGGHSNNPQKLHQVLAEGIERKKGHISSAEVERIRKRMIGDYIVVFDSLKSTGQNFISYHFRNMNLFDELRIIKEISIEDLEARLREHFNYDYHAVSMIYPQE